LPKAAAGLGLLAISPQQAIKFFARQSPPGVETQIAQKQAVLSCRQCNAVSVSGSQGEAAKHRKFTGSHRPGPVHKENDTADLTQFSRMRHPGKSFGPGHFTGNPRDISRPSSTFLVKINIR
jgi:hypothetical protein